MIPRITERVYGLLLHFSDFFPLVLPGSVIEKKPGRLPDVVRSRISRHQYCQLIVKMAVRCGKGGFIQLG